MTDVALNQINAAVERFNDAVPRADDIGVVAQTPRQCVVSTSTIEDIVGRIADQNVGTFITCRIDGGSTSQLDILDTVMLCQREINADAALDPVVGIGTTFCHDIRNVVDDIGVIS